MAKLFTEPFTQVIFQEEEIRLLKNDFIQCCGAGAGAGAARSQNF
jgi:hypothetical protein